MMHRVIPQLYTYDWKRPTALMDCRVKPGNDKREGEVGAPPSSHESNDSITCS
jgi:hypothetical protein